MLPTTAVAPIWVLWLRQIALSVPAFAAGAGLMLTLRVLAVEGPLQPFAVTWMVTVPENPVAQVIIPVVGVIDPAAALLTDQLRLVLFAAVVEYVVVNVPVVSSHEGSLPEAIVIVVGLLTVGVITTAREMSVEGPLHPLACTKMVALPENPLAHVITPVLALIEPAPAGDLVQMKLVLLVAVVA